MKKNLLFVIAVNVLWLRAQVSITATDFANAGDTARMSVAVWNPLLDYKTTGANHTWDFSELEWQSQYVDSFRNPTFTHPFYAFTFSNLPINPYQSNIALKQDNLLTSIPIINTIFTEPYSFYLKNNSYYRQKGIGMKVSGIATSVPFSKPDTLYHFPIEFGNTDSANSAYTVKIPQLGSYTHKQKRINEADGWGKLTTPFGTFDVVRVRTEIRGVDSLHIDSLSFGFAVQNDIVREYKWIGKNEKEPLLQIFTQAGFFGQIQTFEFVTKIVYRDSARFLPTGLGDDLSATDVQIYPNPATDVVYVQTNDIAPGAQCHVFDLHGHLVYETTIASNSIQIIGTHAWAKGLYIVQLLASGQSVQKKLVIE